MDFLPIDRLSRQSQWSPILRFFLAKPNLFEPTMRQAFFVKATQSNRINMIIAKQSHPLESPQALLRVTKHLDIPPRRKILRTLSTGSFAVQDELDKAKAAFNEYRSTRRRDAIYDYLSEVFTTVRRWKQQDNVKTKVHQALKATGHRTTIRNREPFSVIVFCTSNADIKTRSKWARALRFAERSMLDAENLCKFIKRLGGINECADRFSKLVR
jgi:hypothetical protein